MGSGEALAAGYRHPLPWTMPDRDNFINLEPALVLHEGRPKPYKLRLGSHNSYSAVFTADELRELRDRIDEALAAPFLVRVLGGPVAELWMASAIDSRLTEVLGFHPDLVIAHALRAGSVDELVDAWARERGVPTYVDPAGPAAGGNAAMVFMTGDQEQNMAWVHEAEGHRVQTWWVRPNQAADRSGI